MSKQDENNLPREGLETARFPTGVGSNPTPRTSFHPALFYPSHFHHFVFSNILFLTDAYLINANNQKMKKRMASCESNVQSRTYRRNRKRVRVER
jgi:hypothetical protein